MIAEKQQLAFSLWSDTPGAGIKSFIRGSAGVNDARLTLHGAQLKAPNRPFASTPPKKNSPSPRDIPRSARRALSLSTAQVETILLARAISCFRAVGIPKNGVTLSQSRAQTRG